MLLTMGLSSASATVGLRKWGNTTQLVVDGKPMLILGGELSNSAASSVSDIESVMPLVAAKGLNTVFVPVSWDLLEPVEGQFDFTLPDALIRTAREHNLRLVILWFGAWKNSMSCYAPLWFKTDSKRFPRSMAANGKPLEIATAFSDNVMQADRKALLRLMEHIKDVDGKENTVIMLQVENEIGMLEAARDHSPLAEKAWRSAVPSDIVKVLGGKQGQTWAEVVGTDLYGEEKFQAYYYARYVEELSREAKNILPLPIYVNAAMNSRGRTPGQYPSAGPLAHLMKIWHTAAPSVDIIAPDLYDSGYKSWVARYKTPDNPFFTPEVRLATNSGVRALYTFGEVDAISYSPFAIDHASTEVTREVKDSYTMLSKLSSMLIERQGAKADKRTTWGLLFDQDDKERVITDGDITITCRHFLTLPWDPRATDGTPWPEAGGIVMRLGKGDYLIAGNGLVVTFESNSEVTQNSDTVRGEDGFEAQGNGKTAEAATQKFTGKRIGLGYVDQVDIDDSGNIVYLRRDNGDEDHQGRHARISCGEYKMLHVKLYEY